MKIVLKTELDDDGAVVYVAIIPGEAETLLRSCSRQAVEEAVVRALLGVTEWTWEVCCGAGDGV
jgi:hypothetical protein